MNRRDFLLLCTVLLSQKINAKTDLSHWDIIKSTLKHMFPKTKGFYGCEDMGMENFIKTVSGDKYFDKDDLELLIKGSYELFEQNKNITNLNKAQMEEELRIFESYNQKWLSTLLYYGFEAMLSDPLYGGNKDQKGWKNLKHNTGLPRPLKKYGKNHV